MGMYLRRLNKLLDNFESNCLLRDCTLDSLLNIDQSCSEEDCEYCPFFTAHNKLCMLELNVRLLK